MAGHEVLKAATAKEALELCERPGIGLDLVISDVTMPGMSGRDLAKCVRKLQKPIPLVLMSGYPVSSPVVTDLVVDGKLDDSRFLSKPFLPNQLLEIVSEFERAV